MTNAKRTYEAMFLVDSGSADLQAASEPIRKVLDRNEAEVLSLKAWDDRPLAYPIEGRRRGLYVLTYFNVDPERVREIEHDCQLDDRVLRAMILRKEKLTEEELNAETPASRPGYRAPETEDRRPPRRREEASAEAPAEPGEPDAKDEAPAGPDDNSDQRE